MRGSGAGKAPAQRGAGGHGRARSLSAVSARDHGAASHRAPRASSCWACPASASGWSSCRSRTRTPTRPSPPTSAFGPSSCPRHGAPSTTAAARSWPCPCRPERSTPTPSSSRTRPATAATLAPMLHLPFASSERSCEQPVPVRVPGPGSRRHPSRSGSRTSSCPGHRLPRREPAPLPGRRAGAAGRRASSASTARASPASRLQYQEALAGRPGEMIQEQDPEAGGSPRRATTTTPPVARRGTWCSRSTVTSSSPRSARWPRP